MFSPRYEYNDKLVQDLIKLEHSRTTLFNTDLNYNTRTKLLNRTKIIDVFHIAHLLKSEITLKDAEKIVDSQKLDDIDEIRNTILKNAKNTLDFNRSNIADSYSEIDKSVILHVNKLMLFQWRETWEANLRNFNDKIDDRWDNLVKFSDDSILVKEIENELDYLIEWYKASVPTVSPILRIGIAFFRLLEIAPFVALNKITIIMIVDYLLSKNGYGNKIYSSFARVIDQNDQKFQQAFEVSRKAHQLTYWLELFIGTISSEVINVREELNQFVLDEEKSKQQPFLNLNKRQLKVLKYLQNVPTIKREDYCHMMEVSTMTAFRDLDDLVRKKLIKIDGRGRGTKYKLSSM